MSYIAFQYAEALFSLALESNEIQSIHVTYEQFLEAIDEEIMKFMNHPNVNNQSKKEVLDDIIEQELFKYFLYVLIDNNRINELVDIMQEFITLVEEQEKRMRATVYSKSKLSDAEIKQLSISLEKKHNRSVTLENLVDKSIVGGVRIEYEGRILDSTVNGYLHRLQATMKK